MALLDLLGRRWALRILWELHQHGPINFRALRMMCGDISPTVLNARLTELREAGIVELRDRDGYFITTEGIELGEILRQLNIWAKRWAKRATSTRSFSSSRKTPKTRQKPLKR